MAELKTKRTDASVKAFIDGVADEGMRKDCRALAALMKQVTKSQPRMWGTSIVGFGTYRYRYDSGREGDWFLAGFSPRKQNLTIYLMSGYEPFPDLMKKLGKHSTGRSCLYIKRLGDISLPTLKTLIAKGVRRFKAAQRL